MTHHVQKLMERKKKKTWILKSQVKKELMCIIWFTFIDWNGGKILSTSFISSHMCTKKQSSKFALFVKSFSLGMLSQVNPCWCIPLPWYKTI
jgi:hypothetical protein